MLYCTKIIFPEKVISHSSFTRFCLMLYFVSFSLYLACEVHTSLSNNLQIVSKFYFDLHTQAVSIHKFRKTLVTNRRICPRFCFYKTQDK